MNFENNSSFHASVPMLQVAWDSTSLGTFKECPYKYYLTMILGRVPRDESVHLTFGAHYHKALEIYDHNRSQGKDHTAAQLEAVRYCYTATVVRLPNGGFRPWLSDDSNKNRLTLMRTVIWYLEQFENDSLNTIQLANGKPAVELSFRMETGIEIPGLQGETFVLCGHIDRLVEFDGDVYFLDRKTSKQTISPETFKKFIPDNQMSLYDFAGGVIYQAPVKGGIIDAAQVAVGFSRFQRGFLHKTAAHREEWYRQLGYWLDQAAGCAMAEYWPQNDKSCGNYGGCPFRELCSKSPLVRDKWINGMTAKREWDPLKVRGDI